MSLVPAVERGNLWGYEEGGTRGKGRGGSCLARVAENIALGKPTSAGLKGTVMCNWRRSRPGNLWLRDRVRTVYPRVFR